jgi:hypothetical protein
VSWPNPSESLAKYSMLFCCKVLEHGRAAHERCQPSVRHSFYSKMFSASHVECSPKLL